MKASKPAMLFSVLFFIFGTLLFSPHGSSAQSYATWYRNAQERIDTLRRGDFGIRIVDKNGQPYKGEVSVRMAKHEFPFGAAFDFYEAEAIMGNSYSSPDEVQAEADAEIYQTERWATYLAYAIPVESGKKYIVTLKFAEIFHGGNNARIFDVKVEGNTFLERFDTHLLAGGKNIAIDTSLQVLATNKFISIELIAVTDNVAIKGIMIEEVGGDNVIRINCGGSALTTIDGNTYITEHGLFVPVESTVASREQWMKAAMYKYFNAGVSGNSFKWSGIQSQNTTPNYNNFDNAVRWTQKVGWDLRAHTLLWGGYDYDGHHEMPRWVKDLPTTQAVFDACETRIKREMTRYKGIIKDYDVMNEPIHATYFADSIAGDSINWYAFKWAHEADPSAELYINEYNVEYNWGSAAKYRDLILKIKEKGGNVTGVGMQAHFWDCCRPNVDELVKNVNIVAEAGLPIKFTEYDFGGNLSQAEQASDYIKVLTIAFSHPSIVGMYHWGINDAGAWRENSGFFESNYKPKLAADTLLYFTKTKWSTNFDTVAYNNDPVVFNAYYGNYNIEVEFDGIVKVFNVPCLKANADSIFILHENDAVLKGPQLITTELVDRRQVKLIFDKPIDENTIKRSDFKFYTNRNNGINAVEPDPANNNELLVSLSANVIAGNYLAISYFPGNLKANDGSTAAPFGPKEIPNPVVTVGNPIINNSSIKIYPNPATDMINIEHQSDSYRVSIYNSLGMQVFVGESDNKSMNLNVSGFNRGIYMIRLTNADNKSDVQKFLLK